MARYEFVWLGSFVIMGSCLMQIVSVSTAVMAGCSLPPYWFIVVEVEADVTYNPVFIAKHDLWKTLGKRLGTVRYHTDFVNQPRIVDDEPPIRRASLISAAFFHGARCSVTTTQFGVITQTVWILNFKTPHFSAYGFLEEMAQWIALNTVHRLADAHA